MSDNKEAKETKEVFAFTPEMEEKAKMFLARYPEERSASAVMPLLDLAQRQHQNWLPRAAMDAVAEMLEMPRIRVYEVATFYTMYNLAPVGEHFVQICTTTPCWLRGSDDVVSACKSKLGVELGETTADGKFTVIEVECLGACANAPMMQVNDDYYENLTADNTAAVLDALAKGDKPKAGPQSGRRGSGPAGGPTTLQDFTLQDSRGDG